MLRSVSWEFFKERRQFFLTSDFLVPIASIIGTEGRQNNIMVLKSSVAIMLNG